jgi:hypothetical protein
MDDKTVPELKKMAKEKGYSGYSKLRRDELIKLLKSKPKSKSVSRRRKSKTPRKSARRRSASNKPPVRPRMTDKRRKMIHRAHIVTGIHKADLQDLPMEELEHYSKNFPKQKKLTESRKQLVEKVVKITGQHKADLQDYPTEELKRYLGKNSLGKEWKGKHKKFSENSDEDSE